jgi:hypothetical protein
MEHILLKIYDYHHYDELLRGNCLGNGKNGAENQKKRAVNQKV